jgi:hypothetical protein
MFNCLAYDDTGWFLGRKELKRLRLTVLKSLLKMFSFYGLEKGTDFTYNQQDSIITFGNFSDIFLVDLDSRPSDPEHLWTGGYEWTGGAVDESNECSESIMLAVNGRCGWRNNDKYDLPASTLETFNPDKGHVNRRYWIPFRDKSEKSHIKFVRALPTDNPHPSVKIWVENMLKAGDKKRIDRLVYGNFDYDADPDKIFEFDKLNDMFSNSFVESGQPAIIVDSARLGGDKATIYVWRGWIVEHIEEINKSKMDELDDRIKYLKREYKVPNSRIVLDITGGLGSGIVDIRKYVGFESGRRAVAGGHYFNLRSQCYFEIAKKVNKAEIWVKFTDTDIKAKLIEELEQIKDFNADKDEQKPRIIPKDKIKEKLGGRSPDHSDNFMMRIILDLVPPAKMTSIKGLY